MNGWASADAMGSQAGRTFLVTGANSGLGFETARALARSGAEVVLACRNQKKGDEALTRIRAESSEAKVSLLPLDLADLRSVREAATRFASEHELLDGLVNNAGLMALPFSKTEDGFEMQIGTNHLGHFALTGLLLPSLEKAKAPRVVTVTSLYHKRGKVDLADLFFEKRRYDKWVAYAQSKLANLLFAFELQRRASKKKLALLSLGAHPGYSATELQGKGPKAEGSSFLEGVMKIANAVMAQSQERGALPQLRALTDPAAQGGELYGPSGFQEVWGDAVRVQAVAAAHDEAAARGLWERSIELTKVDFGGL
ncbi:MAG: SDR family NAD(P)-dependent oxidoreductase [Polyangiaceae bacterium]|nr:SDR family NAD(P)-dependent oxidoreductase [Polyangiaceae bacterium]